MTDTATLLRLSPAKVARLMRVARTISRVSQGIYPADATFETLVVMEDNRRHARQDDAANVRRSNFR